MCRRGCRARALHLMEGGIVIRSTAGTEMLGSAFTRGAEAVRLDGRPRKVDRLIDSSSEKEDRPYRCWRMSRCARMRDTEGVEFKALPPPDSATVIFSLLFFSHSSTSDVCLLGSWQGGIFFFTWGTQDTWRRCTAAEGFLFCNFFPFSICLNVALFQLVTAS